MCTQQLPQPARSQRCANSSTRSPRARLAAPSLTAQRLRIPVPVCNTTTARHPAAANHEGNPSLSLLHLCFSQSTATVKRSFPLSCEHVPLQTPSNLTSRGQQHRTGERELTPLLGASSTAAKHLCRVRCAAGCSVTFVSTHTSTTQLLSAKRRPTASSELFLTCRLTNTVCFCSKTQQGV